jgi:hypothetical protein
LASPSASQIQTLNHSGQRGKREFHAKIGAPDLPTRGSLFEVKRDIVTGRDAGW